MSGEPIIVYDNILERSTTTVTVDSAADGYSGQNLKSRMLFDRWKTGTAAHWLLATGTHTGTFVTGETVTGGTSGVTAVIVYKVGVNNMIVRSWGGSAFTASETLTGGTSGATAAYSSITRVATVHLDLGSGTEDYGDAACFSGHNLKTITAGLTIHHGTDNYNFTALSSSASWGALTDFQDRTRILPITDSLTAKRYWLFMFTGLDSDLELGALCFGQRLTFPEYMAMGFDHASLSLKSRQGRSRDGSYLGTVVEHVSQRIELKIGDSGFVSSTWYDDTGTPSWDDFLRTCWSHGKPFWFSPYGGDQYRGDYYCFPAASEKHGSPWISGTQRGMKFGFDCLAEGFLDT